MSENNEQPTREYKRGGVVIQWFANLCEHCGHCKETLPRVFRPDERPWVNMDAEDPKRIAEVANECPTKALRGQIVGVLLLALLPTIASAQQPSGRVRGWAWALVGAVGLEPSDTPAPSPTPNPGGKCETCSGTGKVGDGRVSTTCRECNGTGVINATPTPEPAPPPAAKRGTIVMYCRPGCIYCDKWVAQVKPQLVETWTIDEKKDPEGPVPHFEIRTGSRVILHQGYLSIEQLNDIVGGK